VQELKKREKKAEEKKELKITNLIALESDNEDVAPP